MAIVVSILTIALFVVTLVDIIRRDDAQVRYLPRLVWIIIVILLPLIGSALWWGLGREYDAPLTLRFPRRRTRSAPPAPHTPAQPVAPVNDDDARSTEQQMADLDREIEEWRLREEIARRRRARSDERGDASPDVNN